MFKRVLRDVLQPINTAAIVIMGAFTVLWGAWVANPFWRAFNSADMFSVMAQYAPEWAWGCAAMAVGITMIHGVWRRSYSSLALGSFVGFLFWIIVSLFFFLGDWQNTGGITYGMIAVYCGFIRTNLYVNRSNFAFRK